MSCFICQAFSKNSPPAPPTRPPNPQLAQECLTTPLSRVPSHVSTQSTLDPPPPPPPPLHSSRLPCYFFLTFSPPPPRFISSPPSAFLSARLLVFSGMPVRLGGEEPADAKTSRNARGQHKELLWRWAQICLDWTRSPSSLLPFFPFIIFFSPSWPVVHPTVAFSTLPYWESHFPLFQPLRCFPCRAFFLPDLVE